MSEDKNGSKFPKRHQYEEALNALSSLITRRTRADGSNMGDRFDLLFDYVKILDLEESIKHMKVIHVAGTKGKGSTCTFSESILRNCGFRTGLFTSPHLIDVRERFRLDGVEISEEKFLTYFWWCWDRLQEKSSAEVPMPTYFRFLALLSFKIFADEQVDVAILEVGLGGKFDATNVVEKPVVCGISSLGYDHMEILGNTLGQIAGEKAGIFKRGVPAFTVPQPEEAMSVLEKQASLLDVNLEIAAPLDPILLGGMHLGLEGEHQYLNAGLAIALCSTWLQRTGRMEISRILTPTSLPEEFIKGLVTASLLGRAQVVSDQFIEHENPKSLVFYLDGAHSPESMDVCAKWFCHSIKEDFSSTKKCVQILLFNCMSVRDPQLLLPRLLNGCSTHGVHFEKALFVPNTSVYNKVGNGTSPPEDAQVDVSWQLTLQRTWERLIHAETGGKNLEKIFGSSISKADDKSASSCENSSVFTSLPVAINWIRDNIRRNQNVRFQVLVTGSLHLVGDILRLVTK